MNIAAAAKRLLEPPPYHSGPAWMNALGWQLARIATHQVAHTMRRPISPLSETAELIATGEREGAVVIPNFLQPHDFERLKHFSAALPSLPTARHDANRGNTGLDFIQAPILPTMGDESKFIIDKIANDPRLLNIVSALARRTIPRPPAIGYQRLTMRPGEEFRPDAETILHADRHFPAIKAYYSLNGSTLENGAYVWCYGSHKLTPARRRYEYADSIRFARLRAKHNLEIPNHHLVDMGLVETPILTEPNTLVISNNFGFHRRGYFAPGAMREQIRMVFHYLEEPLHAAITWKVLRGLGRRNMLPSRVRQAIKYRLT